jgi:hypothetical protein
MEPKLNRYDKDNELIECENDLIIWCYILSPEFGKPATSKLLVLLSRLCAYLKKRLFEENYWKRDNYCHSTSKESKQSEQT